jgi:glyoxylase-like metal-dependent hydrolase (beta-lactamase superfamily II)
MGDSGPFDLFLQDGKSYGTNVLSFAVIHTPGHSPGGVCLYFKQAGVLFTGDTLFEDGTGRTDLDGGEAAALQSSLKKLARLPQQTVVFPGHGGKTTLQVALRQNRISK